MNERRDRETLKDALWRMKNFWIRLQKNFESEWISVEKNLMEDDDNGIRSIWTMGVLIKWLDVTSGVVIGITWPQQGHAWCLLMASPTFQLHDIATKALVIYLPSLASVTEARATIVIVVFKKLFLRHTYREEREAKWKKGETFVNLIIHGEYSAGCFKF